MVMLAGVVCINVVSVMCNICIIIGIIIIIIIVASSSLLSSLSTSSLLPLTVSAVSSSLAAMCVLVSSFVFSGMFFFDDQRVLSCRGAYGAAMASCKGQEEVLLRSGKCKLGFTHYTTDKPCHDGQFVREGCHQGEIWGRSVAGAGDGRCQRLSSCRGLFYLTKKV